MVEETIRVMGIGNAGCNAVEYLMLHGLPEAMLIVADTSAEALGYRKIRAKLQLGKSGLGAGANAEYGQAMAKQSSRKIKSYLAEAKVLFVIAGLGGGTGTGAAPVVASIARGMGILTVGFVISPFHFEGSRLQVAELGITRLTRELDSLFVISNEALGASVDYDLSMDTFFNQIDDLLLQVVSSITTLIRQGHLAWSHDNIRNLTSNTGLGAISWGGSAGDNAAKTAIEMALASPLLWEKKLSATRTVMLIISAPQGLPMTTDVSNITNTIREYLAPDTSIMVGTVTNPNQTEALHVVVLAFGIDFPTNTPSLTHPSC